MKKRQQYIEEIIENMHALRRKFVSHAKGDKDGETHHPVEEWSDITVSQWMALTAVMRKDNIGITQLARDLCITTSASTQVVNELVDKGYLTRSGNPEDRRALSLSISDKHKKKINDMKARSMERFTEVFSALTDEELSQYAALNKKIARGIPKR